MRLNKFLFNLSIIGGNICATCTSGAIIFNQYDVNYLKKWDSYLSYLNINGVLDSLMKNKELFFELSMKNKLDDQVYPTKNKNVKSELEQEFIKQLLTKFKSKKYNTEELIDIQLKASWKSIERGFVKKDKNDFNSNKFWVSEIQVHWIFIFESKMYFNNIKNTKTIGKPRRIISLEFVKYQVFLYV